MGVGGGDGVGLGDGLGDGLGGDGGGAGGGVELGCSVGGAGVAEPDVTTAMGDGSGGSSGTDVQPATAAINAKTASERATGRAAGANAPVALAISQPECGKRFGLLIAGRPPGAARLYDVRCVA